MSRSTRPSWILFVSALLFTASFSATALAQATEMLFFIQRSKNANEIHYDARLAADGILDAKGPVGAY